MDKIEEMFKEVLDKAMDKQPTPKDESCMIQHPDGRRIELCSASENLNALIIKGTRMLEKLKAPAPNHIGTKGDPLSLGYVG